MRAAVQLQNWTRNVMLIRKRLQKENSAAIKLQASIRGFLVRKKLPKIKHDLHVQKLMRAATMIQVNCLFLLYKNCMSHFILNKC